MEAAAKYFAPFLQNLLCSLRQLLCRHVHLLTKPIRESAMSTKAMQRQKTFSNGHDLWTQIVYSAATHYFTVHIHRLVVSAFCLTIWYCLSTLALWT